MRDRGRGIRNETLRSELPVRRPPSPVPARGSLLGCRIRCERPMRYSPIILVPCVAAVACAGARMAYPATEPIQTDAPIYTYTEANGLAHVTIRMTYRNTTGGPVYLPMCQGPQPPRLQKQVGDKWVVAFSPNVLACEETPQIGRASCRERV